MSLAHLICVGWGFGIRTPIALPGTMMAPDGQSVSIEIEVGDYPPWREEKAWGPYRVVDADLFEFAMPGVARFTCLSRRRIIITPERGACNEGIAAMLIATVLPALIWARGEIVLHAAAAVLPGAKHATLVAAPLGGGKSTLLRRAMGRGAFAVAEDSVRLRMVGGRVVACGLPGGIWLSDDASRHARQFVPIPAERQRAEHPVGRLIVIEPESERRRILTGHDRLVALLRHRHRHRITMILGTEPDFIELFAQMARQLRTISTPGRGILNLAPRNRLHGKENVGE